jgi:hypothetical protein
VPPDKFSLLRLNNGNDFVVLTIEESFDGSLLRLGLDRSLPFLLYLV